MQFIYAAVIYGYIAIGLTYNAITGSGKPKNPTPEVAPIATPAPQQTPGPYDKF